MNAIPSHPMIMNLDEVIVENAVVVMVDIISSTLSRQTSLIIMELMLLKSLMLTIKFENIIMNEIKTFLIFILN